MVWWNTSSWNPSSWGTRRLGVVVEVVVVEEAALLYTTELRLSSSEESPPPPSSSGGGGGDDGSSSSFFFGSDQPPHPVVTGFCIIIILVCPNSERLRSTSEFIHAEDFMSFFVHTTTQDTNCYLFHGCTARRGMEDVMPRSFLITRTTGVGLSCPECIRSSIASLGRRPPITARRGMPRLS